MFLFEFLFCEWCNDNSFLAIFFILHLSVSVAKHVNCFCSLPLKCLLHVLNHTARMNSVLVSDASLQWSIELHWMCYFHSHWILHFCYSGLLSVVCIEEMDSVWYSSGALRDHCADHANSQSKWSCSLCWTSGVQVLLLQTDDISDSSDSSDSVFVFGFVFGCLWFEDTDEDWAYHRGNWGHLHWEKALWVPLCWHSRLLSCRKKGMDGIEERRKRMVEIRGYKLVVNV